MSKHQKSSDPTRKYAPLSSTFIVIALEAELPKLMQAFILIIKKLNNPNFWVGYVLVYICLPTKGTRTSDLCYNTK